MMIIVINAVSLHISLRTSDDVSYSYNFKARKRMKRQMLLLAALLMVGLGAWAQKAEQKFNPKKFQVLPFDSIIRRISLIPVMMPARMIMSICLLRDGIARNIRVS